MGAKLTEERTLGRRAKIQEILGEREEKKHTPDFVSKYFGSFSGGAFLARNPPEPPTEEVMTRMRQRIERSGKDRPENAGQAFDQDDNAAQSKGPGASIEAVSN